MGRIQVELSFEGWDADVRRGEWFPEIWDCSNDTQLPIDISNTLYAALSRHLCGDEPLNEIPADLMIHFDENRDMVHVAFQFGDEPVNIELTHEQQREIFDHFENRVMAHD